MHLSDNLNRVESCSRPSGVGCRRDDGGDDLPRAFGGLSCRLRRGWDDASFTSQNIGCLTDFQNPGRALVIVTGADWDAGSWMLIVLLILVPVVGVGCRIAKEWALAWRLLSRHITS
jgi:hypothetical protein